MYCEIAQKLRVPTQQFQNEIVDSISWIFVYKWFLFSTSSSNFQITMYDIHLWKSLVPEDKLTRTTTERKAIFTDLDDNTEYQFQVRASTRKGPGPWSSKVSFRTDRNIIRAPLKVQVSVFRN